MKLRACFCVAHVSRQGGAATGNEISGSSLKRKVEEVSVITARRVRLSWWRTIKNDQNEFLNWQAQTGTVAKALCD